VGHGKRRLLSPALPSECGCGSGNGHGDGDGDGEYGYGWESESESESGCVASSCRQSPCYGGIGYPNPPFWPMTSICRLPFGFVFVSLGQVRRGLVLVLVLGLAWKWQSEDAACRMQDAHGDGDGDGDESGCAR